MPNTTTSLEGQNLWLAQYIYLDGDTWVHIAQSREAAFAALATWENLTIHEGRTAEDVVDESFGDSEMVSYNVCEVNSIDLG